MRLAIADPPYPPQFGERRDRPTGPLRLTTRSRALRWYGDGPRGHSDPAPADFHPEAGEWDDPMRHRLLMEQLIDEYDGWAIATTPDGLGAYHPLPVSAKVMAWIRPNAMPSGSRILSRWEPVILFPPEGRRARSQGPRVPDVLTAATKRVSFAGSKPPEWTKWILDALGYQEDDEVIDLFPGSGSVTRVLDGVLPIAVDREQS